MAGDFDYNDVGDNRVFSMQPMQRFLYDPSPLTDGLLHAKLDRGMLLPTPHLRQYDQVWPSVDCFTYSSRNGSPDRTSVSGNSSHAPYNELRSPHPYQTAPYGSPGDFSQSGLPYPSAEHFDEGRYPSELPSAGGIISLREIEYHQEAETTVEEQEPEPEPVDQKPELECDPASVYTKVETIPDNYQTFSGSRISSSPRDAESVQPMSLSDEEASDSDYKPMKSKRRRSSATSNGSGRQNQRRRRRKSSTASTLSSPSRVTKRTRGSNASSTALKPAHNHSSADTESPRPFPCPLAAYGCQSKFVSKNEWKRHVSTQHIKCGYWRCDLCATDVDANDDSTTYHNDFNRKDLFTQHLRRMHAAPAHQVPSASRNPRNMPYVVTEDNITQHQQRCYQTLREAPPQSACLFCEKEFSGPMSWEERMEHVGKHLEKERKGDGVSLDPKNWNRDEVLERWLVDQGLIEVESGEWKIGDGKPKSQGRVEDEQDVQDEE